MPCVRLILAMTLVVLGTTLAPAGETAPGGAVRIGTLNLEQVFAECVLVQRNSAKLGAERQKVKQEIDDREEELKELRTNFKMIPPDRPVWDEMKEKVEVASVRFKLFAERRVDELQRMEAELIKQSYLELRKLVGEYADEKGIGMVFLKATGELGSRKVQETRLEISMRQAFWADEGLDITEDFIAFANARTAPPDEPDAKAAPKAAREEAGGFEKTPAPKVP